MPLGWRKPVLHREEDFHQERRTGWLELFLDLVFMAIVAQLSRGLSQNISWFGVLRFVVLFVPPWWMWVGATVYHDRFESEDLSHRFLIFLQMLPIAALAYYAQDGMGKASIGFACSYISARLLLIFLWLRGGYHNPEARPMTNRYAVGFSISVLLWSVSLAVQPPLRFCLWGLGLAFDIGTPKLTLGIQARLPRMSASHLPERYGLFTLIVLGESVIGVIQSAAASPNMGWMGGLVVLLALTLAFGLWWFYFIFIFPGKLMYKPGWIMIWNDVHLPLWLGLTAVGAALQAVMANRIYPACPGPCYWLLGGAFIMILLALSFIRRIQHLKPGLSYWRVMLAPLVAAGVVAIAMAEKFIQSPLALLMLLVAGLWGGILLSHQLEKPVTGSPSP